MSTLLVQLASEHLDIFVHAQGKRTLPFQEYNHCEINSFSMIGWYCLDLQKQTPTDIIFCACHLHT